MNEAPQDDDADFPWYPRLRTCTVAFIFVMAAAGIGWTQGFHEGLAIPHPYDHWDTICEDPLAEHEQEIQEQYGLKIHTGTAPTCSVNGLNGGGIIVQWPLRMVKI